ncbi:ribosome maturation factor RimP [Candidatus Magnetominusculus xianensis]|uniref:Ribosome maturation factor RimP n=1 Tax=Candidatus Magnetominusculus xianensis TaxID=1748249 RepID=A0ABR5SDX8_9BACT|nr:ribosome maturation factor RimP [Candidatus Magnetominusculus xianensis]KWT83953.1 ribosome maturation factor RimP [Candidatus Magnetominusculus xianensis]MBF0402906.1 ribosome maturation factor RimP [Nitrospirota bacterium]
MEIMRRLEAIVREAALQRAVELFSVELKGQGARKILRVTIDKESSVGIADCEGMSRDLSARLDVEGILKGGYTLEVTSPGIDRPLRNKADFVKYTGKLAKVVVKGTAGGAISVAAKDACIIGKILSVTDDAVTLEDAKSAVEIKFHDIIRAKLEIEIK